MPELTRRRCPDAREECWHELLTNLRASHRLSWICICVAVGVVVGDVAAGQGPPRLGESSGTGPVHDQEPIRPIPPPPAADPLKLALGERLDPRLSANGTLTCASCHDIHTNGASGGPRKAAPDGSKPIDTLTVFNAALNFRLNWEGNYRALAAHAESSLENPVNLNTSVDEVVRKLNADPQIVGEFRAAYGGAPDRNSFLDAMVTFERSLLTPGSRFDRWLGGDDPRFRTANAKATGCSSRLDAAPAIKA